MYSKRVYTGGKRAKDTPFLSPSVMGNILYTVQKKSGIKIRKMFAFVYLFHIADLWTHIHMHIGLAQCNALRSGTSFHTPLKHNHKWFSLSAWYMVK